MTQKEKEVQLDLEKARQVGKTVEFIATFGTILCSQIILGNFSLSLALGIVAYAIVNGVLEVNLKGIKERLGL